MLRWTHLLRLLGFIVLGLGSTFLAPLLIAIVAHDDGRDPLLLTMVGAGVTGLLALLIFRPEPGELSAREGILLVVLAWVVVGVVGGLPYYFSLHFASFTDSVFESVSGFTTTGSSILLDVEGLPASLLFWRCFTHWLGGLGIILLMIAVLPLLGSGNLKLYRAEFSGSRSERIKPRIAQTARALWRIYIGFTVVGCIALRLAGMTWLDAFCHTFSALGTGGFSNRNASIEAYRSGPVEFILIVLMIAGGLNFTQHYNLLVLKRVRSFLGDIEVRTYFVLLLLATLAVTASLRVDAATTLGNAARLAVFQVVSIMTATGFSSTDFNLWPPFAQLLLLALMFVGGCTGSTAGGLKVSRFVTMFQSIRRQGYRMVRRRVVFAPSLEERTIESMLVVVAAAILTNVFVSLLLTATGVGILTSLSAATSTMFNVGPGLAAVGPASNYGHLCAFAKWVLILNMIAGRLEFLTFLVVFTGGFWRR